MRYTKLYNDEPVCIQWGADNIGFGEVVFFMQDGILKCDNETMGKDFIKSVLCTLVDKAEFTDA